MTLLFFWWIYQFNYFYEYISLTITYQLQHQIMPVNLFRDSFRNWESLGEWGRDYNGDALSLR